MLKQKHARPPPLFLVVFLSHFPHRLGRCSIHHRSTDPLTGTTAGAPPGPEGASGNPGSLAIGAGWNMPTTETTYGTVTSETPSYDPSR
jgi:hypothetical protein